jgi:hypothetical protein
VAASAAAALAGVGDRRNALRTAVNRAHRINKTHILYDGGHRNLVTRPDLLGEVLDWFDRYLGPVESVPATLRGL